MSKSSFDIQDDLQSDSKHPSVRKSHIKEQRNCSPDCVKRKTSECPDIVWAQVHPNNWHWKNKTETKLHSQPTRPSAFVYYTRNMKYRKRKSPTVRITRTWWRYPSTVKLSEKTRPSRHVLSSVRRTQGRTCDRAEERQGRILLELFNGDLFYTHTHTRGHDQEVTALRFVRGNKRWVRNDRKYFKRILRERS